MFLASYIFCRIEFDARCSFGYLMQGEFALGFFGEPAPSISSFVSLGETLHPPFLLLVVRRPSGANCMAAWLLSAYPRAALATV